MNRFLRKIIHKKILVYFLLFSFVFLLYISLANATISCFTNEDKIDGELQLYRNAPPPINILSYLYFPITNAVTAQTNVIAKSTSSVNSFVFLWANRCSALGGVIANECLRGERGNPIYPSYYEDGVEVRAFFSTFDRADYCTLIQTGHLLGERRRRLRRWARRAGLNLAKRSDDLSWRITNDRFVDLCVLADETPGDKIKGVVIDYEVQDGRTANRTFSVLTKFAKLVRAKGKSPIIYTNPLDGPSQVYTNIDKTNAPALQQAFDKIGVLLWSGNKQGSLIASFNSQLDVLRGPDGNEPVMAEKIMVVFELLGTTLDDAKMVRGLLQNTSIKDLMFWRNGAQVGGSCDTDVNLKIFCLTLGECR